MTPSADLNFMRKESVLASPTLSVVMDDDRKAAAANVRAVGRKGAVDHAWHAVADNKRRDD